MARKSNTEVIEQVRTLRAKGMKFVQIADQLGLTKGSVAGIVWRLGMSKPHMHRDHTKWRRVIDLFRAGKTRTEIANMLGLEYHQVQYIVANSSTGKKS